MKRRHVLTWDKFPKLAMALSLPFYNKLSLLKGLLPKSLFALGKTFFGESVSGYVARSLDVTDRIGLDYRLNSMGTLIEGEWNEVFALAKYCFEKKILTADGYLPLPLIPSDMDNTPPVITFLSLFSFETNSPDLYQALRINGRRKGILLFTSNSKNLNVS